MTREKQGVNSYIKPGTVIASNSSRNLRDAKGRKLIKWCRLQFSPESYYISGVSHDSIADFLQSQRLTARSLWEHAKSLTDDTEASFLIVDDSVQEKPHAKAIELVYPHYSGNKHAVVRGIAIVNLVHSSGDGDYYPIDYRIYAPEYAKETKKDYFLAMLKDAFELRKLRALRLI